MLDLIPGPWKLGIAAFLVASLALTGWALHRQIKENGKLEATIEGKDREIAGKNETIAAWKMAAEDKAALTAEFGKISADLNTIKTGNATTRSAFQRGLEDVRRSNEDVARVLGVRAPADVVGLLCNDDAFTGSAAAKLCGVAPAQGPVPGTERP